MSTGPRPWTVLLVVLALFAVAGSGWAENARESSAIAPSAATQGAAQAAPPDPRPTTGSEAAASKPLDVLLVLDNSGSMRRNDPQGLMRRVVKDFGERLDADARLGVVLFDQTATMALSLTAAGTPTFGAQIAAALQRLTYRGKLTNIPAGVERALYEFREREHPGAERVIVLLTDGIVDVGSDAQDAEGASWLRNTLAAEARDRGIQIFGVAFTEQADFQLLQVLAQTTGGRYFRVRSAADIGSAFADVQESIAAARTAPAAARGPTAAGGIDASRDTTAAAVETGAAAAERTTGWSRVALAGIGLTAIGILAIVALRGRRGAAARQSAGGTAALPAMSGMAALPSMPAAQLRVLDPPDSAATSPAPAYDLDKPRTRIGRAKDNDVILPYRTVSAHHAVIEWRDGAFHLTDLGSANGTRQNGTLFSDIAHRETRSVRLRHLDRISFDTYAVEFLSPATEEVDATEIAALLPADATDVIDATIVERGSVPLSAADVSGLAAATSDTWPKPEAIGSVPPGGGDPAITRVKNQTCANHGEWPASDICSRCGKGWCEWCLTERDGKPMCIPCASAEAAA